MFSTSTMASSTNTPITRDNASRVTVLMEKPRYAIPMNAGMTDKGSATAETMVERRLPKNSHTTTTASKAPSKSMVMEASNSSATGFTKSKACVISRSGCWVLSSCSAACTAAPTSISLAPLLRVISNPTTGTPLSKANARGSATVSLTEATSRRRKCPPLARPSSTSAKAPALVTVATVRMGCSLLARSVRPPALSLCTWRS